MKTNILPRYKFGGAMLGLLSAAVASAEDSSTLILEEIIVTAQKRVESLSDTPLTVNVVTGEQIAEFGSFSFQDISNLTAGLSISGTDFDTNIAARGLGTDLDAAVSPRVAVYLDGTYIQQSRGLFSGLYDVRQVELLRGPQGTLYGQAAPAGTLTIRTANPNLEEIDGYVRQTFNDRSGSNSQIGVSLPIVKNKLGLRIAGVYDTNENSGVENISTGKDLENETTAFRAVLYWQPSDNFDLRFSYHDIDDDFDVDPVVKGSGIEFDDRVAVNDFDSTMENETNYTILETNYSFSNDWVLTFVGSRQENKVPRYWDQDASAVQGREQFVSSPSDADGYELRLSSQGNEFWDWTVGAFYMDAEGVTEVDATTYLFDPRAPFLLRNLTSGPADLFAETAALFSHNSFHLSENGTLTLGVRYNDIERNDEQPFTTDTYGLIGDQWVFLQTTESDGISPSAQNYEDDAITGTLKYQYRFSDDFMAYATYDKGWRAGSANVSGSPSPPVFGGFDAEDTENIELGFKWDLLGGRGMWNFAVYYQVYTDFHYASEGVEYLTPDGVIDTASPIVNVDEAESYGFDSDLTLLLTESWMLRASLSYNQAELTDAEDVPCTTDSSNLEEEWQFNSCDLTGERAGNQPEWSGNISAEYWGGLNDWASEWYVRGMLNAESEYYSIAEGEELDSYTTADLYLGLRSQGDTWDVNVWVKNVTDETAELKSDTLVEVPDYENGVMVDSGLVHVQGQLTPRTYGVTFNYNF